jgi:hypothetical protein
MQTNSSGEIDLLTIITSLKNKISAFFRIIGRLTSFSLKNATVLLTFVIVCGAISLGLFFSKKKVYASELVMSHTRLNNNECYLLVNALGDLCENSNYKQLASRLNSSIKVAQQLKSISHSPLNQGLEDLRRDSSDVILPFKIGVKVFDADVLDSIQYGLWHYLETNEYALKRKSMNDVYLNKFEEKIKKELVEIDSLKQVVNESIVPRGKGQGIILGEPIDPVKVYQSSIDLYKVQLNVNQQRELNNSFEVLVGFSPALAINSIADYILYGILTGLLFGLLWLLRRKETRLSIING